MKNKKKERQISLMKKSKQFAMELLMLVKKNKQNPKTKKTLLQIEDLMYCHVV